MTKKYLLSSVITFSLLTPFFCLYVSKPQTSVCTAVSFRQVVFVLTLDFRFNIRGTELDITLCPTASVFVNTGVAKQSNRLMKINQLAADTINQTLEAFYYLFAERGKSITTCERKWQLFRGGHW